VRIVLKKNKTLSELSGSAELVHQNRCAEPYRKAEGSELKSSGLSHTQGILPPTGRITLSLNWPKVNFEIALEFEETGHRSARSPER